MRRFLLALFSMFIVFTPIASSQDIEERVEEHILENGFKVLLMERHFSPTVAAYIVFRAGSVDEEEDSRGIAHMLEHMLFKGTKTVGTRDYESEKIILKEIENLVSATDEERSRGVEADKEKLKELERRLEEKQEEHKELIVRGEYEAIYTRNGAVGFNAGTSNDYTIYTINLPSNRLELWAFLESDRLKNYVLREFYTEREAVAEERRMRVDTDPQGKLYEKFMATAFQVHPYGEPIIGYEEDIASLTVEEAEEYFRINYAPNNSAIVIVGDIDPGRTLELLRAYFGDIPSQPQPEHNYPEEPPQKEERRVTVYHDAEPQIMMGFHKPTVPHFDDYVFDIISGILSSGRTSRFYRNIIETGIGVSVTSSNGEPGARFDNLFMIAGAPRAPHTNEELEEAIWKELEKLKTERVEEEEFNRFLKKVDAGFIRSLRSNSGMARQLCFYEAVTGDWRYILEWREVVNSITPEDIMRVAQKYFVRENYTVAMLEREEEEGKE